MASASSAHGDFSEEVSPAASPDRPREDDNIIDVDPETLGEDSSVPLTQHASIVGSAGDTIMEGTEQTHGYLEVSLAVSSYILLQVDPGRIFVWLFYVDNGLRLCHTWTRLVQHVLFLPEVSLAANTCRHSR